MKFHYNLLFLLLICLCGCSNNPAENINELNGYWEIDHVKLADGSVKTYNYSEQYDYFELKSEKGTRRKVTPLLLGKYLTTDVAEDIKILHDKNKVFVQYSNYYNKWSEELLKLDKDELELKNNAGNIFYYKRPKAIKIE